MKDLKGIPWGDIARMLRVILEVCVVIAVMMICMTVLTQQITLAGPEQVRLFRDIAVRTAREGNMLTAFVVGGIGFVAVPFVYFVLWLHRLDKYMTIRRFKKKFDHDRLLLEDSNLMID